MSPFKEGCDLSIEKKIPFYKECLFQFGRKLPSGSGEEYS